MSQQQSCFGFQHFWLLQVRRWWCVWWGFVSSHHFMWRRQFGYEWGWGWRCYHHDLCLKQNNNVLVNINPWIRWIETSDSQWFGSAAAAIHHQHYLRVEQSNSSRFSLALLRNGRLLQSSPTLPLSSLVYSQLSRKRTPSGIDKSVH